MGVANVATPERIVDHNGLSRGEQEQINLIQQFEADFNVVDHFLRGHSTPMTTSGLPRWFADTRISMEVGLMLNCS
jgi:hypothetical protein